MGLKIHFKWILGPIWSFENNYWFNKLCQYLRSKLFNNIRIDLSSIFQTLITLNNIFHLWLVLLAGNIILLLMMPILIFFHIGMFKLNLLFWFTFIYKLTIFLNILRIQYPISRFIRTHKNQLQKQFK